MNVLGRVLFAVVLGLLLITAFVVWTTPSLQEVCAGKGGELVLLDAGHHICMVDGRFVP